MNERRSYRIAEILYERNQETMASFFEDERYGEDEFIDELVDDIVAAILIAEHEKSGEEYDPEVEDSLREQVMDSLT